MKRARAEWHRDQGSFDPTRLVFLDETWVHTAMTPTRGRAPRGERCVGAAPHGHWKTTTFVAALRCDAVTAPLVLDGPMNGICFRAYVQQLLCATLRPGDVVIADNLSSHKVAGIREAIGATGATLRYLPPILARPQSHREILRQAQSVASTCHLA